MKAKVKGPMNMVGNDDEHPPGDKERVGEREADRWLLAKTNEAAKRWFS